MSKRPAQKDSAVARIRIWYAGANRTPEGIRRRREQQRKWNAKYRSTVGGITATLRSDVTRTKRRSA